MYTQVQNNCSHVIALPPTQVYPQGFALVPGSNNVPDDYLESLKTFKVPHVSHDGRHGTRPLFEDLAEPSKTSGGKARVVVLGAISPDAPQGPPPPYDLAEYGELLALKIIEVTSDRDALVRWSKDRRAEVAGAAVKKLGR